MTVSIGLSGGIGSGKSTVSHLFEELGATLVDADAIVHELQAAGSPLLAKIEQAFGREVIADDGTLDRAALGAIVFRDAEARRKLGMIMHPPVVAEMMRRQEEAKKAGVPLCVVDIPLLFEGVRTNTGAAAVMKFDALVLVWVPVETQIERTIARDACTREEAQRRIDAQMPIDEKRELAHHVIDNSGTPRETEARVRALWAKLVCRESE